jgi:hypothetical protein
MGEAQAGENGTCADQCCYKCGDTGSDLGKRGEGDDLGLRNELVGFCVKLRGFIVHLRNACDLLLKIEISSVCMCSNFSILSKVKVLEEERLGKQVPERFR